MHTRLSFVNNHAVCQVGRHDEVVLHNECCLLGMQDVPLQDARRHDTLLDVEIRGRLVDQVDVSGLAECQHQGDPLELTTAQGLHLVVGDLIDEHWLGDISLELRVQKRIPDLHQQQVPDCALELRGNDLWLIRNVHLGKLALFIHLVWLQQAGKHTDEGGFACAILPEHDDDLAVGEVAPLDLKLELLSHDFRHVPVLLLVRSFIRAVFCVLRDLEGQGNLPEAQVLRRHESVQKYVDALPDAEGHGDDAIATGGAPQTTNEIGEVVQNSKVMLYNNDVIVHALQFADDVRGVQALLDVQVGRWLIEHVHLRILHAQHCDREALQLPPGKVLNLAILQVVKLKFVVVVILFVPVVLLGQNVGNLAANLFGDLVDVLGLAHRLQAVLQQTLDKCLELASTEVGQNLIPIWWVFVPSEVWLRFTR
mmetsp:Transcript_47634/g.120069  ORF Transcript_47634/g.120069 Transcript_47634/m.120069 type:complete len:424 (+) Transcript_47634:411-1682(+)